MQFIAATKKYNTLEKWVSAPYFRKSFYCERLQKAQLKIATCGFYELYFNGEKITKGFLAPYISNTNQIVYCDVYEVQIEKGENVIGVMLGNGFQNNPGGFIWEFDKADFRSAPKFALELTCDEINVQSDASFKTHESPIIYDDYRYGEMYDANREIVGWCERGFCDEGWNESLVAEAPKGELKPCTAEPILKAQEIGATMFWQEDDSFIYDFGVCESGICQLQIDGKKGQKIELVHGEILVDGKFDITNICCDKHRNGFDLKFIHKNVYICKDGKQTYMPTFAYHGFRYVKVSGITREQANKDLLKFVTFHSALESCGGFECSDETLNKLEEMTRRSDISNFYYFPTDCPQREKNGWTADIALSCEQILLNFNAQKSFAEWMRNVCKAQNGEGAIPCIVPTAQWGYGWGSGPAWDCVLAWVPYYVYKYTGETSIIKESANTFYRYLEFLASKRDSKGLVHFGLGDWCHAGRPEDQPKAPLEVTDTVMSFDIAQKMEFMFGVVGMNSKRNFAKRLKEELKNAIRKHLIDFETMTVYGECQTAQALCLEYGIFEKCEQQKAFSRLLDYIHQADDHIDCGVLGGRVIFHLLSKFGYSNLAYKMITRKDFPSYAYWIEQGATTLWENFDLTKIKSCNHHFWGDISAWFKKRIAGIDYNPNADDINYLEIKPDFITDLQYAYGFYDSPFGTIESKWQRKENIIELSLTIPKIVKATAKLGKGYLFEDGENSKGVASGKYLIKILE